MHAAPVRAPSGCAGAQAQLDVSQAEADREAVPVEEALAVHVVAQLGERRGQPVRLLGLLCSEPRDLFQTAELVRDRCCSSFP